MTVLEKEILDCKFCPFLEYEFNKTKELGFGQKNRIMFVGSSPAVTSNKSKGESRFDYFFEALMQKVDITKKDYYFTNLVKTSIPAKVVLTEEQAKHCFSHLLKEILEVKPQLIVLLGKVPRDAFGILYPNKIVMKKFNSKTYTHKAIVYAAAHPGMLHYKPDLEANYLKNLKIGLKYYKRILI